MTRTKIALRHVQNIIEEVLEDEVTFFDLPLQTSIYEFFGDEDFAFDGNIKKSVNQYLSYEFSTMSVGYFDLLTTHYKEKNMYYSEKKLDYTYFAATRLSQSVEVFINLKTKQYNFTFTNGYIYEMASVPEGLAENTLQWLLEESIIEDSSYLAKFFDANRFRFEPTEETRLLQWLSKNVKINFENINAMLDETIEFIQKSIDRNLVAQ